jgi:sulfoxide reductase heme-binding subunit YedZ
MTLVFLTVTVAITPVRKIFGVNSLVKLRRMVGLFAFFYGTLHLTTYIWLDRLLNLQSVVEDVARRPFILLGMTAFVLMVPLALTSTNNMVKRLGGKNWELASTRLRRSCGRCRAFLDAGQSDTRLPLTFAFIVGLLLAHRVFVKYAPTEQPVTSASLFQTRRIIRRLRRLRRSLERLRYYASRHEIGVIGVICG